jgi:hypothetical protein
MITGVGAWGVFGIEGGGLFGREFAEMVAVGQQQDGRDEDA